MIKGGIGAASLAAFDLPATTAALIASGGAVGRRHFDGVGHKKG